MKPFILFDIDGTLHTETTYHYECYKDVTKKLFNIDIDVDEYKKYTGKPQKLFIETILRNNNLEVTEAIIEKFNDEINKQYIENADKDTIKILSGVKKLLDTLRDRIVPLGLVTGNTESVAFAKLKTVGLEEYFDVGGFGSDSSDRWKLVRLAIARAKEKGYKFDEVYIVGDTPFDIKAGKKAEVKTIGVGTSEGFSEEDLMKEGADYFLPDLTDTKKFLEIIGV